MMKDYISHTLSLLIRLLLLQTGVVLFSAFVYLPFQNLITLFIACALDIKTREKPVLYHRLHRLDVLYF